MSSLMKEVDNYISNIPRMYLYQYYYEEGKSIYIYNEDDVCYELFIYDDVDCLYIIGYVNNKKLFDDDVKDLDEFKEIIKRFGVEFK